MRISLINDLINITTYVQYITEIWVMDIKQHKCLSFITVPPNLYCIF